MVCFSDDSQDEDSIINNSLNSTSENRSIQNCCNLENIIKDETKVKAKNLGVISDLRSNYYDILSKEKDYKFLPKLTTNEGKYL